MRLRSLAVSFTLLVVLAVELPAAVVRADSAPAPSQVETKDEPAPQPKAAAGLVPNPKVEAEASTPAKPAPAMVCKCNQAKPPVYIEDWGRLADLTRSDRVVFEKADFWRNRRDTSQWLLAGGLLLGGGAAALGTLNRLSTDAWSTTSKWCVAGGLSVAAVSVLVSWAFAPDRDDLLTVINHWNLRHPDLALAP